MALDANLSNTALLLHFENGLVDTFGHEATLVGSAIVTTSKSRFGASCLHLPNQATDKVSFNTSNSDITLFAGDFTVECWHYAEIGTTAGSVFAVTSGANSFALNATATDVLLYINSSTVSFTASGILTPGMWQHVAFNRAGTLGTITVDGVQKWTGTISGTVGYTNPTTATLGGGTDGSGRYLDEFRITNGVMRYPVTQLVDSGETNDQVTNLANAEAVNPVDSYWDNVVLAMHLDGPNADTNFVDLKGKTFTTFGAPQLSTAQYARGISSLYFNNASYVMCNGSSDFAFGTGDFTVEFFVRLAGNLATTAGVFDCRPASTNGAYVAILNYGSNRLGLYVNSAYRIQSGVILSLNTWYHVAVSRVSGTTRMFINGTQGGVSYVDANNYGVGASRPVLGSNGQSIGTTTYRLNGFIDELRVTKGVGRYSSNFGVSSDPFPEGPPTQSVIRDESSIKYPVTRFGNVVPGTFSPISNSKYSVYLDGTGDFGLPGITSTQLFSAGAFTYEAWVFPTGTSNFPVALVNDFACWINTNGTVTAECNNGFSMDYGCPVGTVKYNKWTHVAITYSNSTYKLYVNGVLRGSLTQSAPANRNAGGYHNTKIGTSAYGDHGTGYIRCFRTANVELYTGNFTPELELTAVEGVTFLTACSNRLIDLSSNARAVSVFTGKIAVQPFTPVGSDAYSVSVNGGSAYFDGTGDYLTIPIASTGLFGGSFTVECFVYLTSNGTSSNRIFETLNTALNNRGITLYVNTGVSTIGGYVSYDGTTINLTFTNSPSVPLNTWAHVAVSFDGSNYRCFLNGVAFSTNASTTRPFQSNTVLEVGGAGAGSYFSGYIANFHATASAKYVSGFSMPTSLSVADGSTKLLMNFTNFATYDKFGKTQLEFFGNAKVSTAPVTATKSLTFDGTAATYVRFVPNPYWNFDTADFSIEFSYYKNAQAPADSRLFQLHDNDVYAGLFIGDNAGVLTYYLGSAGNSWNIATAIQAVGLAVSTWHHIRFARVGSLFTVTLNGKLVSSLTSTLPIYWSPTFTPIIGGQGSGANRTINGYIENFKVWKGRDRFLLSATSPTEQFDDTSPVDPTARYNVISCHMNGNAYDTNGHFLSTGNVQFGPTQHVFGSTAGYFPGNAYVNFAPINGDTKLNGDFTIELWFYKLDWASARTLFEIGTYDNGMLCRSDSANTINVWFNNTHVANTWANSNPVLNTWYHLAVCRVGGTITVYLNGVAGASTIASAAAGNTGAADIQFGSSRHTSGQHHYGYMDEMRFTNGMSRYTGNFTTPTEQFLDRVPEDVYQEGDPYFGSVTAFISGQGAQAGTVIADAVANTWTNSSVTTSNGRFVYGHISNATTSAYFNGSASLTAPYVTTKFDWWNNAGGFTVEMWVNNISSIGASAPAHIGNMTISSGTNYWSFGVNNGRNLQFYYYNGASISVIGTTAIPLNTWAHIAMSRIGNTIMLFVNGALDATATISGTPQSSATYTLSIGAFNNIRVNGYMRDIRVTQGVARYRSSFTPPQALLPEYLPTEESAFIYVEALMNFDGISDATTIVDEIGHKFISEGAPALSSVQYKFGETSLLLNGTSSLRCDHQDFIVGDKDFTLECFAYYNATGSGNRAIFSNSTIAGEGSFWLGLSSADTTKVSFTTNSGETLSSTAAFAVNTWNHIALSRTAGVITVHINGTAVITTANSEVFTQNSLVIGTNGVGYFGGYVDSLRATIGYSRYSANFAAPTVQFPNMLTPADPHVNSVVNIKAVAATPIDNRVIVDAAGHAIIYTAGRPGQGRLSPFSKTGTSTYFAANGNYLAYTAPADSVNDFDPQNSAFCLEFFCMPNSVGYPICMGNGAGYNSLYVYWNANVFTLYMCDAGTTVTVTIASPAVFPVSKWYHVAATRTAAGAVTFYINGKSVGTATYAGPGKLLNRLVVNGLNDSNGLGNNGGSFYISNVRWTKGSLVYTGAFTPPARNLTLLPNTKFLGLQDNSFFGKTSTPLVGTYTLGLPATIGSTPILENYSPFVSEPYDSENGSSLLFNGGDAIEIATGADTNFGTGDFTIECWVYPLSGPPGAWTTILSLGSQGDGKEIRIGTNLNSAGYGHFYPNNNSDLTLFYGLGALPQRQWTHLALVRESGTLMFFSNGVMQSSPTQATFNFMPNTGVRVGNGYYVDSYFNGYVSDLRIVKGISVYSPFTNFTPPTEPLKLLSGTSVLLSGTNYAIYDQLARVDIASLNNASVTSVGKFAPAMKFNNISGDDDILIIPDVPAVRLNGVDWTIECWIKPDGNTGVSNTICTKRNSNSGTCSYQLYLHITDGYIAYYNGTEYISAVKPVNKVWSHVAATFTNGTLRLFLNGKIARAWSGLSVTDHAYPLYIGNVGSALTEPFVGQIEDFRITKGICRYVTNFTIPTSAYPDTQIAPLAQTVPDPVTGVTVTSTSQTSATITFVPPVNDGGSDITQYTVTSTPGDFTSTGTSSPLVVSGLTYGTPYTFTVVATNAIGDSVGSTSAQTYSVGVACDPYYDYVVLNSHYNNTLADTKCHTVINNATTFSTLIKRFGSHSLNIAAGQYYSVFANDDFTHGIEDFTAECWFYQTAYQGTGTLMTCAHGNDGQGWHIAINGSGYIYYHVGANGSWQVNLTGTKLTAPLNRWNHVALVRQAASLKVFVNGYQETSLNATLPANFALTNTNSSITIGGRAIGSQWFTGNIDEVRVTRMARYTGSFVPANAPFPDVAFSDVSFQVDPYLNNVVLGCHFDNTFNDIKKHAITNNGAVTFTPVRAKLNGFAATFSGSNWLSLAAHDDFAFGNGDFTIEGWFNSNSISSLQNIVDWRTPDTSTGHEVFIQLSQIKHGRSGVGFITGTTTLLSNTWYHFALSRKGVNTRMFLNGIQEGDTYTTLQNFANNTLRIGNGANGPFRGMIDDLRITKGVGRYTSNFVPSLNPFPELSEQPVVNTSELMKCSGGKISYDTRYTVHTFTATGKFTVSDPGLIDTLIVAGGGGGGKDMGGGGGGGGVLYYTDINITSGTYEVVVGAGGTMSPACGTYGEAGSHHYTIAAKNGENSTFLGYTALGGGFGGSSVYDHYLTGTPGNGGSGGGASGYSNNTYRNGGTGTSGQGYAGGRGGLQYYSGGGGGAGGAGTDSQARATGGVGILNTILGDNLYWAGGGGGSGYTIGGGDGGIGGGGGGAIGVTTGGGSAYNSGFAGTNGGTSSQANVPGGHAGQNTGGGGGGGSHYQGNNRGGMGGSGVVIVRYVGGKEIPNAPQAPTVTNTGVGQQTIVVPAAPKANGAAITSYKATSTPGNLVFTSPTLTIVATDLSANTSYTWNVQATNEIGDSALSPSSTSVTTWSVPSAPTNIVASDFIVDKIQVSFTAPYDGGTPVTLYTVRCIEAGIEVTSTTSPITIGGLTLGTPYLFEIAATNAVGQAPFAGANSITPVNPVVFTSTGDNSFTLSIPANTAIEDVFYRLSFHIADYGWEVWDYDYSVYRAINKEGSYKYLRIIASGTVDVVATTEAWEAWNNTTHVGTNRAGPATSGQITADYTKTGFYLNSSTSATTLHVFATDRWMFVSSTVAGSTMGRVVTNLTGATYNYGGGLTVIPKIVEFSGIGGVVEFETDRAVGEGTPFMWTHTGWACQTNDSVFSEDNYLVEAMRYAFEPARANVIGKCPRHPNGVLNADVKLASSQVSDISEARRVSQNYPNGYEIELAATCQGSPIGSILGLKLGSVTVDGVTRSTMQEIAMKVDANFNLSSSGVSTTHVCLTTRVETYCEYYQSAVFDVSRSKRLIFTPAFFIPK